MPLEMSHGAFTGSYMTFGLMREVLCRAADWPTDGPTPGFEATSGSGVDWSRFAGSLLHGDEFVLEVPEDPLVVLAAHSEAAGRLPVVTLTPLADRITELLPKIDDVTASYAPAWAERMPEMIRAFRSALRLAARKRQEVRFG